jgi:hypothetical protein
MDEQHGRFSVRPGLVCQKEFEMIDRRVAIDRGAKQQQTAAELEEPFLPGLLAA